VYRPDYGGSALGMPPVTDARVSLPRRYRVVSHIANGGMASVWAAEDELLGRLVAVKVLSAALAEDDRARERFLREARAGARLSDCRHIVTIYDIGEHDGRAFLVMKHLAGGTLADRVRRDEPIPRPLALRWLREAAEALDFAHRHDVVHRDVKPANLLLDERDELAVADFGIAKVAAQTSVTQSGQVLGTAAYLSPEQALGRPATAASDRYALALVAFELLTGARPFAGDHPAAQLRAHAESVIPPASRAAADLGPEVDRVLRRGLAKEPAQRPATAVGFAEALGEAVRAPAPAVTAPTAVTRPVAPRPRAPAHDPRPAAPVAARRRRPRAPLLALGALALVAGAALAIALGGGSGPGEEGATTGARRAAPEQQRTTASAPTAKAKAPTPATTAAPAPATSPRAAAPQATTPPTTSAPAPPAAAPAKAAEPAALNARGKALIDAGKPAAAVPVLLRSVGRYRDTNRANGLPYAFALYNLGHALRLAGRPGEAVPVLQERLRASDNQRSVVERELTLARRQAGLG
jgi:eukaryotic-like serine/threonine-protein kinase